MWLAGGKLGKLLGPKKLMPNVKLGTVATDLNAAIADMQKGQAGFRVDGGANIHGMVGKLTMDTEKLVDNGTHSRYPLCHSREPHLVWETELPCCRVKDAQRGTK